MASSYPGRNMFVGVGIQNGFAEAAGSGATVFTYYQIDEPRGGLEEYSEIASNRRLNTRFRGAGYIGTKQVPAGFTVELNPANAGRLLKLIFGTETVAVLVTAEAATHKFYPAESLSYGTIVLYAGGIAEAGTDDRSHKIINWKAARASIEGGVDDMMRLTVDGFGTDRSAVTSPTATFTTARPFFLNSEEGTGVLSIGATIGAVAAFAECRRMRFEIDNAIAPDHRIDGDASAAAVREGDSQITGMWDMLYNDATYTELDIFTAGTNRAFQLVGTSVAAFYTALTYQITLAIEAARYNGAPPAWDPDVMSVEMPYIGELASAQSISVTIRNADVVAYTYSV